MGVRGTSQTYPDPDLPALLLVLIREEAGRLLHDRNGAFKTSARMNCK
jgi:hypothetical protein